MEPTSKDEGEEALKAQLEATDKLFATIIEPGHEFFQRVALKNEEGEEMAVLMKANPKRLGTPHEKMHEQAASCLRPPRCAKLDLKTQMYEALKAQHEAIDRLFATLAAVDHKFYPTRSGQPWAAMVQGHAAINRCKNEEGENADADNGNHPSPKG